MIKCQHVLLKNRTRQTNLISFFDRITVFIYKGYTIGVIYLIFSKAFERSNHSKEDVQLIEKAFLKS